MLKCIILGIVQGIAEFLPISSSAHLIIVPYLFGWAESSLAFDVALHFGTLLAVLFVFFGQWWKLFVGACNRVFKKKQSHDNQMFWYLILATIPGAFAGLFLEDIVEGFFRKEIVIIALTLAIMGILIYIGDKWASKHYQEETHFDHINLKQALLIGCSQAFAVIPGFSRSGTTILTGRLLGLSREAVTKFTFLLSVPIIAGATILKIPELVMTKEVIVGILTACIVGIISIKFLLNYVKKNDFALFAFYRVILAIIVLLTLVF